MTGYLNTQCNQFINDTATGAFSVSGNVAGGRIIVNGTYASPDLYFDASASNSIYSDSATTITVDSLKVGFYIRY